MFIKVAFFIFNNQVYCLPPYSPFLNPIELFWAEVKAGVKKDCLTGTDISSDRIINRKLR
jgi:transposase